MPRTKGDEVFDSDRFYKVLKGCYNLKLTHLLLRLGLPFYGKANHYDPKDITIFAVGQSHLDSAWNWRWMPDTAPYKLSHTVGYNLGRLERFPPRKIKTNKSSYFGGYKFSFPAPAHYEYVEKMWPKAFKKLQQQVKTGRWELLGGMWVEADGNVPDGESFVRQRLYGQKYFIEKFGKKAVIAWLPDTFGYAWTLPQILKKSGAIGFHTTKLTWNRESRPGTGHEFPFCWFEWQSPDGTTLLSTNVKNGWRGLEYMGKSAKHHSRLMKKGEAREFSYETDIDSDTRRTDEYIREIMWSYGEGDGGHGPLNIEILVADTAEQIGAMQLVKAGTIYKLVEKKYRGQLPIWNDELYLEFHRGVQTTLHRLKAQNRYAEIQLHSIEKALSFLFGNNQSQPDMKEKLDETWKKVLFNQFHDILPGSSIEEVYQDTDKDFYDHIKPNIQYLWNTIENLIEESCGQAQDSGNCVIIYPHDFDFTQRIPIEDPDMQKQLNTKVLYLEHKGINIETLNLNDLKTNNKAMGLPDVSEMEDNINIKTTHYTAVLQKNSVLSSLLIHCNNKNANYRELANTELNVLRIFEDYPTDNDAWNIDAFYREKQLDQIRLQFTEIHTFENLVEIHFSGKIGENSTGTLIYTISNLVPYIECELDIDWQEAHRILRIEFDTTIRAQYFTTGIPYGTINRPTRPQLPLQKGRWEVPGNRFIALDQADNTFGLAVFVVDKYGFHGEGSQFGISLLRAPSYGNPDDKACQWYDPTTAESRTKIKDLGQHHLQWAIYPHNDDWQSAQALPMAINFNNKPTILSVSPNSISELQQKRIVIETEEKNVILSTLKPAYDKQQQGDIIFRFVELYGKPSNVKITTELLATKQIIEVDLLEDPIKNKNPIPITNTTFEFEIAPYEIKSFRLKK